MIRTTITPVTTKVYLSIPKKYIGKELEILLFSMDEAAESRSIGNVKKIQWQKYKGILSVSRAEAMQKYVEQSRNEWERDT